MTPDLFGAVSTADNGQRSDFDFYETPAWMTASLLHFVPEIKGRTVLEPCSGRDAIANVLRRAGCRVSTNDIDVRQRCAHTHVDATLGVYWDVAPPVEWVIGNFPFNIAFDILRHAFEHPKIGLALLLRKSFMEPTEERGPWLSVHPPTRVIGLPRHNFRGTGSGDSVSTDWFIWDRVPPTRGYLPFEIDYQAKSRRLD